MVDSWSGEWKAEKDYTNYPLKDVCDMDKIAMVVIPYIKDNNYEIKTTIENICYMIMSSIEFECEEHDDLDVESELNSDMILERIEINGGLEDFDYNC